MVYLAAAALIIVAAAGLEQELVLFYAVAVFVSFLVGLLALTRFARSESKPVLAWVNGTGRPSGIEDVEAQAED
ncbi:hypothetical protein [Streptomyces anandii]|uniref:hypothetical protein n=1 Tax=Streptomyces anandii TaxID=285454 RepID=UPI0019B85AB1|nr:hypothetical protein [Streptomyces anandii]GGY07980.1 hypothetical protein GCM10010510_62350 [Streptomyces anandii JCM 4720]